jgi:hypothetical protein
VMAPRMADRRRSRVTLSFSKHRIVDIPQYGHPTSASQYNVLSRPHQWWQLSHLCLRNFTVVMNSKLISSLMHPPIQ